eukprot:9092707-Pyramimonas_sp.AAC.1
MSQQLKAATPLSFCFFSIGNTSFLAFLPAPSHFFRAWSAAGRSWSSLHSSSAVSSLWVALRENLANAFPVSSA